MPESLCHFLAANVGNALEGKVDMNGVAAAQVVLDVLNDQLDEVAVCVHQNRNKQVALQ